MTWVCIECAASFESLEKALEHTVNPRTKNGPGLPRKKHNIFGRGERTSGSIEPAGQAAVPLRECETPPTSTVAQEVVP